MNYKDFYPFDNNNINEVLSQLDVNDPVYDWLNTNLLNYNEELFCNILLCVSLSEILETYPEIMMFFYEKQLLLEYRQINIMEVMYHQEVGDLPNDLKSVEHLRFLKQWVCTVPEFTSIHFVKNTINGISLNDANRVVQIIKDGNIFRIKQLRTFVKESDFCFDDTLFTSPAYWTVNFSNHKRIRNSEHKERLKAIIVMYWHAFFEVENNKDIYVRLKQMKEQFGIGSAWTLPSVSDIPYELKNAILNYFLLHEGEYIEMFFRYVLGQEDFPERLLNLVYTYLAQNHISQLTQIKYEVFRSQNCGPERKFMDDEPYYPECHLKKMLHIDDKMLGILCGELIKSKFLSKDTNVADFKYVFGCGERSDDFKPIIWTGLNNGMVGRNQILYLIGAMGYPIEEIKVAGGCQILDACFAFSIESKRKGGYAPKDFPGGNYPVPTQKIKSALDKCLKNAGITVVV